MPYVAPSKGTSNAFKDRERTSSSLDPNQVMYKNLKPGDFVDIRFLTFEEEAFMQIRCRKAEITNPKTNKPMTINVVDLGYEVMSELIDSSGTPLNECKTTYLYRLPVWVYRRRATDKDGVVKTEEINELKYIEFGPGLAKSLEKLEEFQDGMGEFNQETGRPDYDVRLKVVPGQNDAIPKNYEFEPVLFEVKDKKRVNSSSFGVEAETVLKKYMSVISEKWDEVVTAMKTLPDATEVRRQLSPKDNKPAKSAAAISTKPELAAEVNPGEFEDGAPFEEETSGDDTTRYAIDD